MESQSSFPSRACLYLLPVPLSETEIPDWIGADYRSLLQSCGLFFVENERTCRRFISSLKLGIALDSLRLEVVKKDTTEIEIKKMIALLNEKKSGILMSESGCPGIADPGALLVAEAHRQGIRVKPLAGPSSVFLALMASGLSGQAFAFHGYLPIDEKDKAQKIKQFERESAARNQTQIFIETPYRNQKIWSSFMENLKSETRLGFASDLLGHRETIRTKMVSEWKKEPEPEWEKYPAVFFFMA
jgi:16S rRNA (cytidine1402-2'-O)-methyltransferase